MTLGSLLGRDNEIAALTDAVSLGRRLGAVLVISGEPGIGKSTLLALARELGREAGYTVLGAVGIEGEMHLPFGGVQQVLAPIMGSVASLSRAQREALGTALGLSHGPRPDLYLIAEAAFVLLTKERLRRPVMIVVDDVQWLDAQSHQILAFLAHRSVASGLLVLGGIRSDHPGPFADAGFPDLVLRGLDDETADRLLGQHAGTMSAGERSRIRREASGNPLALQELPRAWGTGPATDEHSPALSARLEQAFAGRVFELPAPTRDALLVAAVGSSNDKGEILGALCALWASWTFGEPPSADDLFEPAVLAGLMTVNASSVGFRHPLVRSGVLQRETLTRRHAAHRAWGDVLTADAYRRTWHRSWSIVGPDDPIADELAATVPDSLRRGAVMAAVASLERSAQLTSSSTGRGQRLLQAAEQAFGAGRADIVERILREAANVDLAARDRACLIWLTEALNGDISASPTGVRDLCDAARRAGELGDEGLALNLLLSAALRCWWADSGADDRTRVLTVLDELTGVQGDPRQIGAVAVAEPVLRASEVMTLLGSVALDEIRDGNTLRMYALAAYGVGDFVLATDLLDRAAATFRAEGRLGLLPVVLALQLHIRLELGDWSGAAAASDEVNTVSMETGQALFARNNVLVEGRAKALRGEWQAALELIAEAEVEAALTRVNDRICLGYQARGTALLSAGRPWEAFDCLKRQYDPLDPGYHLRESFAGVALLAEAAVDCDQVEEARAIVGALEPVAIVTPCPLLAINLLYARAVLSPEDLRESRFRVALSHDLRRWPWMRARLQLEYGRWLAGVGRPLEAASQLAAAREVLDRIGATRWSRRADAAIFQLGEFGNEPGVGGDQ